MQAPANGVEVRESHRAPSSSVALRFSTHDITTAGQIQSEVLAPIFALLNLAALPTNVVDQSPAKLLLVPKARQCECRTKHNPDTQFARILGATIVKQSGNSVIYSATDLCDHLECSHLSSLKQTDLATPLPKDPPDEQSTIIIKRGMAHEARYLELLRRQSKTIVDIRQVAATDDEREQATRDAMQSGADVIYQAYLRDLPFAGYADFLIKTERASTLGKYSYEVVDTKLALHAKPLFIIQLSLYSEILAKYQGATPEFMHVVLGDGRQESYLAKDFYHYFTQLKSEFLAHLVDGESTYPDPCQHCGVCQFRSLCEKKRLDDDHLWQVANIRSSQIRRLAAAEVTTLKALAETKHVHVKGIGDDSLERLKKQADLQLHKRSTGENKLVMLPQISNTKGLMTLPKPSSGDLFFDIEGDPLIPGGLEYLFGVYMIDGPKPVFRDFWAHSHGEEKRSFQALIAFFTERFRQFPDMHIYHYAAYEETAIKRLMSKYGTMENEVDELLRNNVFVDLYRIVRHSLMTSEPAYSIKNLEHFYMPGREAQVKTASASIVYYERYIETREQSLLDDIKAYNLEDCRSLHLLRDWLGELRKDLPVKSTPVDDEYKENEKLLELQQHLKDFEAALVSGLPDDDLLYTPAQRVDKLVFDLADFYRREAKPAWWRMFSRQTMTSEEIIDDADCIGGLVLSKQHPPVEVKRSTLYRYTFPPQEFKFKEGDRGKIAESLMPAGEIVSIDFDNGLISLKKGTSKGPLPEQFDLVPGGPINTDVLRNSLWSFIDDYIAAKSTGTRTHAAIQDLLERVPPRIAGVAADAPLYDPAALNPQVCSSIAERMANTYLFIQGPPGTGKTYTASHMILHLMKAGKRIGVSANSHKAIHNLLDAVEKRATETQFSFSGLKKSSRDNADTTYDSSNIHSEGDAEGVIAQSPRANLIAGTVWLFANPGLKETLDYLFIDEAGQISLAHMIAAGMSARNIVLVGDQMQLAQPTQGVHPGASGNSVLEYLLQGRHTIPITEGILLDTTYRMHPKVCKFISAAIYDDRIKSHPSLAEQSILHTDSLLPEAGILCDFVKHEGCGQRSEIEAERIDTLYTQLLGCQYRDSKGQTHPVTPDDILVVSPYNMQVNLLKQTLGPVARVGTVDKFQGQEAQVVLVSMATSSQDEVVRGIEFLLSQNRLNVSLSRAKTLAILVLSPDLLSVRCSTIDQMRLVNTLCWAKSYSKNLQRS